MTRLSVNLPPSLHQKARLKAIKDGRALSVIVRDWLFDWVAEPLDGQGSEDVHLPNGHVAADKASSQPFKPITKADQAKGRSRK